MNNYFARGSADQHGGMTMQTPRAARSAALLIDFDNVTLGVHTDLGRELKNLINSEVFRGKIAVRRAYADWRRFPNYVVPLTEASIDLIFAPAYGSSKKNTTDLRMSADAIELAFTRPEIDTFILLTGDSDFSSTVMKLKEYGKYVIGVGMRESSSDLIIQNCDEYFSYHMLTGLTRTRAGEGTREDPWELVVRAAQKMAATGDAMRTDRLKQVMLGLDPGFNEKELGYAKFSRFVSEADKKGLLKLQKLPDGQYEISVDGDAEEPAAEAAEPRESRERRERDSRRGRDRGRRRSGPEERGPSEAAPAPTAADPTTVAGEAAEKPAAQAAPASEAPPAVAPKEPTAPAAARDERITPAMQGSMALLQRALRALGSRNGSAVRDGDLKRKMLELDPSFDEGELGFSKFSRFLRAAHDAEAIDLTRIEGGQYEVAMGSRRVEGPTIPEPARPDAPGVPAEAAEPAASAAAPAVPVAATPAPRRGRGRRGAPEAGPPPLLPGQVVRAGTADAPKPEPVAEPEPTAKPAAEAEPKIAEPAAAEASQAAPAATPARGRGRRGRRGAAAGEPPPPLPGQVVGGRAEAEAPAEPEPAAAEAEAAEVAAEPAEPARKRRRGGRGRKRATEPQAEAPAAPTPEPAFSAAGLGLPTQRDAIQNYLTSSYKGVGKKTVEPMLEAFGEDVFEIFAREPERLREVIGERRAATVLEQWNADFERRTAEAQPQVAEPAAEPAAAPQPVAEAGEPAAAEEAPAAKPARSGRGRRKSTPARKPTAEQASDDAGESAKPAAAEAPAPEKPKAKAKAKAAPRRARRSTKADEPAQPAPPAEETPAEPAAESRPRARSRGGRGRGRKSPQGSS